MMQYDLVVVGAGIQGAGVAQAAAAAGYSVLVLEQTAIAAGTSSKSSKLIHGGLRYLESAQLGLVRESLRERALLLRLAPELVQLKPLHIPIYRHSLRSPLTIRAGLSLYAGLANFNQHSRFSSLPRRTWDTLEGLRQDELRAVFRYCEAQTDDAALTAAVLRSALSLGAELLMPASFVAAHIGSDACQVDFRQAGQAHSVTCRVLFNCAGPWAAQVLQAVSPRQMLPDIELVQGSHLLLPPLLQQYFYLEAPQDRRAVFVLPWQGQLLVGTTETLHQGAPGEARCSQQEQQYLLETLQHYFPALKIDVTQARSMAGLRVLPKTDQRAFNRSRDALLLVDDKHQPRMLTLMGGKLTTYRATAISALARLRGSLPHKTPKADTAQLPLSPL